MTNKFIGASAGMRRLVSISVVLTAIVALVEEQAYGLPGALPGDYNNNGIVSHGDYSVLADTFGQEVFPGTGADGDGDGIVDNGDFDFYRAHYGQTASLPATLPLAVGAVRTSGDELEWTFVFSHVNGGLVGHLNISTSGSSILSVQGGPMFQDDGINPVGVPGINASHIVQEGISFSGDTAFAGLGTTLFESPGLHDSDSTLEFVRLITAGVQHTTLRYAGEFGYQGVDFVHSGSASFTAPEPASWVMVCVCLATILVRARSPDV